MEMGELLWGWQLRNKDKVGLVEFFQEKSRFKETLDCRDGCIFYYLPVFW